MRVAVKPLRSIALSLLLLACEEPYVTTEADATLTGTALVVEGAGDTGENWHGLFHLANAPAGEYLLFESSVAPTSASAIEGFDAEACVQCRREDPPGDPECNQKCERTGVGRMVDRETSTASGPVVLEGRDVVGYGAFTDRRFFVIARKTTSPAEEIPVHATVSISGSGGCLWAEPDAPTVTSNKLAE
jgi:hypothetical protein